MRLADVGLLERRERRWERAFNGLDPLVLELEARREAEGRRERWLAVALAVAFHLAVLVIVFPTFDLESPTRRQHQMRVYRLQQVQLRPPPPSTAVPPARRAVRSVPIPDPTPFDPEPLIEDEELTVEPVDVMALVTSPPLAAADGPPGPGEEVRRLTGEIEAPVKLSAPAPHYAEEARRARVSGVVILETVIDTLGRVTDIRVLKGLPSGLTEEAVAAVSAWRFRPARLDGEPVSVYYLVTVSFDIQ